MMFCADFIKHQGWIQGESLGSRDPPLEIYQRSQKNDVVVVKH